MDWTKMNDSYLNGTILTDSEKNNIYEIIGIKWDNRETNGTEINDCGIDGTILDNNEMDGTQTYTTPTKNNSPKLAQKHKALFDTSGTVEISFYFRVMK